MKESELPNYSEFARVSRAGSFESLHFGFWAYFSTDHFVESTHGILNQRICVRSASKPFQTLACLRLGLSLSERETSIVTSSHSGSPLHCKQVEDFLNRFDLDWRQLQCGEHAPLQRDISYAEIDSAQRRLQNNCSGKHAMMLAVCKLKNWDMLHYSHPEHPLQLEILKAIADLCEISPSEIEVASDGCGLPTYGIKVKDFLRGFSSFQVTANENHLAQISFAMLNEAFYISGKNRLDYELTSAYYPQLITKSGAGGLTMISFQSVKQPVSLLIKMFDSDEKIKAACLKKILYELKFKMNCEYTNLRFFDEYIYNLHNQKAAKIHFKPETFHLKEF